MAAEPGFPEFRQVVLDSTDARALTSSTARLLGLAYPPGDEGPADGEPDPLGQDWLVLRDGTGSPRIAFQQVAGAAGGDLAGSAVGSSRTWI